MLTQASILNYTNTRNCQDASCVSMTKIPTLLQRHQIHSSAWDDCVAASSQYIIYGYSWYLDVVLPAPNWKWVGLVIVDKQGDYQAVMPIPLRRKRVAGVTYRWVVHQPFFCQFLSIFSRDELFDTTPFFQLMQRDFSYGSTVSMRQRPADSLSFDTRQKQTTQILDLSITNKLLSKNYSRDRIVNLRRAWAANWTIIDSTDPEPLLTLFLENHADGINGGVADWAYDIFRDLFVELNERGMTILRYASYNNHIEAGALFVKDGVRIIYLFNAASAVGRQGNARTLLIDQLIQEKAGAPLIFDFESPEKASIRDFYRSFGAIEEPFWTIRWNHLTRIERLAQRVRNRFR